MKKIKILILISLILISIISILFNIKNHLIKIDASNSPSPNINNIKGKDKELDIATLEIDNTKYQSEITGETTIADFMDKLKAERKIAFTEKNYTGMGKFIESINGIKNSGEKNWIYYVNGIKANIGISNYKINPGDIVSWKYEKNY